VGRDPPRLLDRPHPGRRARDRLRRAVGPLFLPEILPAVEIDWRFAPDVWGRGYATEGATAALDEAFTTLGLDRVCSVPHADNPPSGKVAERLGMTLVREVAIPPTDRRGALVGHLYEIARDQWQGRRPETRPCPNVRGHKICPLWRPTDAQIWTA
jgi:RimJ/RimL family protein N-acetyltransferase